MADLGRPLARLLARRRARAALWILGVLGALAVYAPFLANDRPYVLVAVDRGGYESALAELVPLAESYAERVRAAAEPGRGDPRADEQFIARERDALTRRLDHIAQHMPAHLRAGLDPLRQAIATRGEPGRTLAAFTVPELARKYARELDPRAGGVELVSARTFPLIVGLAPIDVFLAAALPGVLLACGLRRRLGRGTRLAIALGPALLLALAHAAIAPPRTLPAAGAIKAAITRGEMDVEQAVFAPLPMGHAETNLGEAWRPPTWLAAAAMDSEGRRARDARTERPPGGRPEVRFGELHLNHPLRHPLGTDSLGRDLLARCLWGGRVSLTIGLVAALLLCVIGTLAGAAAGYLGGWFDFVTSRTVEVVLCFPAFFLVLAAIAWVDTDVVPMPAAVVLVIAAVGWTGTARLVRAEALKLRNLEFVLAARALGLSRLRILVAHVLPNAIGPALVAFAFAAGGAILIESSLAYLGLGVQVPVPSWGALVGEARTADHPWSWIAPGVFLFAAVLAYLLLAEALREALDPREEAG